jgi:hypothetical protein
MSSAALRVAIISTPKSWGGGEQLAWTVGNGLTALGHSVVWLTRKESVLHQRLQVAGQDCLTVRGKYPSIPELVSIRNSLRERGIQTIYGNDSQAINWTGLIGAGLRGVSKIGVKHTIFPIKSSLKYNWFLDRVLCVSNAARQVCIDGGIRRELTRTVYGGLDLTTYDRKKERQQIAAALGISPQTRLYVSVGSLLQCKGFDTLIDAAAILREKAHPFVVAICGDGVLRETLQSQIDHHRLGDSVRLVGFQQDPYRWISASDGLLHPSRSEGLSLVTIAAQLLKIPVVATDVGGLREVMYSPETKQPLGRVVPTDSPSQLAKAICEIHSNHEASSEYVLEAQAWAQQRFLASQMVDGVVRLIRDSSRQEPPEASTSRSMKSWTEVFTPASPVVGR